MHAHAFFVWLMQQHLTDEQFAAMEFMGSTAYVAAALAHGPPRTRLMSASNGHFYLLCGKEGSIRASGTVQLWTDVVVRPPMILQLFVQEKVSFKKARELFIRAGFSAEANVRNIEFIDREYRKRDQEQLMLDVELALRENMRPPRKIVVVENEWNPQYAALRDRYKFLVLEGDSGCGKSRWSRLQGRPEEVFEVDCAGKTHIDLRGLKRPQHTYCLCDEAEPALVLDNRKLFQAGPTMCTLGESTTGMYSYKVWAFRLRFIITSNKWMELVSKIDSDADREWLEKNSVYHRCTVPLWAP